MTNPNPFLAALATQLHAAGDKEKTESAEAASRAAEQLKWDTWSNLYGKSKADWRSLPKQDEMGWGWWIAQDVGPQEWWTLPKKEDDKKE